MTINSGLFGPVIEQSGNPTVDDDSAAGFGIGTIWVNTTTGTVFIAANVSVGAAIWHNSAGGHALVFVFPEESLSAATFIPRPSFTLLNKLSAPTAEGNQRFTVQAGTVGSGANSDVLLESATTPFSLWTARAALALDASAEVSTSSFSGWTWNPSTEKLRTRCSLMNAGTAPKDVSAVFDYD